MNISKDLGYWLFSTLVQSAAALFAIIGVFIVFKIQMLGERLRNLTEMAKDRIFGIRRVLTPGSEEYIKVDFYSPVEMITNLKKAVDRYIKKHRENEEELEKAQKQGLSGDNFKENLRGIDGILNILRIRLEPLEKAQNELDYIKKSGKESLKLISILFVFSLICLLFNPHMATSGILILSTVIVSMAIAVVLILVHSIIKSLEE